MFEWTSDISSNSAIGSLFARAVAGGDVVSAVATGWLVEGECDRSMVVAAASRATAANPEIIRSFMGNLRRFGTRNSLHHFIYLEPRRTNVNGLTSHD